jgi:phosphate-selective porin OprO/OprP
LKPIIFKFILALLLVMSATSGANAIDLYVNTKTKQVFTEPGPDRELIGAFERVKEKSVQAATPPVLPPPNRSSKFKIKVETARLVSRVDSLEKEIKKSKNVKVTLDQKGLQAESADGNFKFKIGGRMHADASLSSNDNFSESGSPAEANNGTEIRRARLTFMSTFHKVWKFKSDIDFADNEVAIKDLKLAYTGLKIFEEIKTRITVGHQKQAFSRELQQSSNDNMYTERSMMNILNAPVVDRAIGVNIAAHGRKWTAQTGVYGESISPNNTSKDEGWGVNGRATFNPILNNDNGIQKLIHLGLAGNYRETSNSATNSRGAIRYKYETSHMSNLYPIDTGTITTAKNLKMIGFEANGVYGPISVGGEFTQSWMDRNNGMSSLAFHGWYGEAALTLTGESRTYKNGVFKRLKPKSTFSLANGGFGAWEIAARVGGINMNDGAYKGGSMKNFSFALNWYANENVRLMFGYDRIIDINNSPLISRTNGGKPDGLNTFMFRTQIAI